MYTVFLAGGIASGKSTVARELARLGATRVDRAYLVLTFKIVPSRYNG